MVGRVPVDLADQSGRDKLMSCASGLRKLGDPTNTTEMDWVRAMGRNPNSISTMPGNQRLLQWHSGTYIRQRVAVLFSAQHRFVKITHRYQR